VEAPAGEFAGGIEFNVEGLELEPATASEAPPAPPAEIEAPALEVELAAPSQEIAEPAAPVVEEREPIVVPEPPAAASLPLDIEVEFESIFQEFRKGVKEQVGDEEFETHYDLGIAYKEMGLVAEAIEEFQLAARGPTRFVDACTMIAACYKDQNRNKSAIAFLERVLADARCMGPGAPYVKYDLAVLYEDEGFADLAVRMYEDIPSIRDADSRLRRLRGGEDLQARTPPGTTRPISYL
jgi:tetratricopeptide (TPR) repeat protein